MQETSTEELSEIRAGYEKRRGKQKAFTREVDTVLRRILSAKKFDVINLESRTKSTDSFCNKVSRDDKDYDDPFRQMTDLTGSRVICYYPSDIEKIATLIEENFEIDRENSVDKLAFDSPDQFGYQSKHIVVRFNADRLKLDDFKEFHGMTAEIQVRTSLQHAWASIEHKLQYKNAEHIAPPLKRKLFRIAALLELADEEFNFLEKNIGQVRKEITKSIDAGDLSQGINADSVDIFLVSSGLIHEVTEIFDRNGFTIAPPPPTARRPIAKLIDTLIVAEIESVSELQKVLLNIQPRSQWRSIIKEIHDIWREESPQTKPVVDKFTIVRIMVCFTVNDKIFRRILRNVPFGPTIQKSIVEARKSR